VDSALAWIGQIASWIGQWIPRWIILDPTLGGVKYVKGKPKYCAPGQVHWYWPVTTNLETYPVARQADDLRTQTIVTTDDKIIVVGGMIVYEVDDVMKLLPTTYRAAQAVKDIALTCIHSVCCGMSWEELKREQRKGTLDTKLRNEARKALEEYGVKVLKVQLTDLAPARVLKVMQSISKDEE
jgi:regulator of protease activity HflC (stomatin/prohibitin superfamily)